MSFVFFPQHYLDYYKGLNISIYTAREVRNETPSNHHPRAVLQLSVFLFYWVYMISQDSKEFKIIIV